MIRPAGGEDVSALARLEELIFGVDAWRPAQLTAELDAPGRRFIVAEDGAVAAYAVAMTLGDVVDLLRIGVHPDHRRRGLAHDLVTDLLAHAPSADRMLLEVSATNGSALAFYAAEGFEQIDVRSRYYRDGSDALVLCRPLAPVPGAPGRMGP